MLVITTHVTYQDLMSNLLSHWKLEPAGSSELTRSPNEGVQPFQWVCQFAIFACRILTTNQSSLKTLKVRCRIVCLSGCFHSASQTASPNVVPLYVFSFYCIVSDPFIHQNVFGRG